nr:MAG TPA: hypothetical protein [Caudoviricetes sp.]
MLCESHDMIKDTALLLDRYSTRSQAMGMSWIVYAMIMPPSRTSSV